MDKTAKLAELEEKLKKAQDRYNFKLSRFRGVPHESAAGELSYTELKVAEDFVESLKSEIKALKNSE